MMTTTKTILNLAEHAIATLPDSLSERKRLLRSVTHALTEKHPAYQEAAAQLAAIEAIDRLNEQLQLKLQQSRNQGVLS